jgi:hypothetical protein
MKRLFLLAAAAVAATAFALPATAGAASFKGVVIAKRPGRDAFVTASTNGVVRTIRADRALKRVRVGRLVAVRAAALPDGTFAAKGVKLLGKARRVHFRGTVVALRGARLFVSAGGSVFALRVRTGHKTGASEGSGGLKPGDEIDCDAGIKGGSLQANDDDVDKVGHSDRLVLEGIYLATADDGTIELAVVHRGRVFVKVPDDVMVPDFAPGDQIALVVSVDDAGGFTLVKAENENAGDDDDDGVDIDGQKFLVAGILASMDDGKLTVNVDGNEHRPVTCSVPDGFDLSGFAVGDRVLMGCKYKNGNPVLIGLRKKDSEPEYVYAAGAITVMTDESITVQGDGEPVSCAIPAEFDLGGHAVGDKVGMYCVKVDGAWTLKALKSLDPPPPPEYLYVTGSITALGGGNITVQGDGEPVTCAVPDGADLGAFALGDGVTMKCVHTDAGLRLYRLQSDTASWTAP